MNEERKNILLIVTGSVAAIKLPLLISSLQDGCQNVSIRVVATQHSMHFFDLEQVTQLLPPDSIFTDQQEWSSWSRIGDPVVHIELRKWAHLGVIAPLDANTMGKIASGQCDNLATCVVRAWDMDKPLLYAPAMNVFMWDHPLTGESVDKLNRLGYVQVGPISKKLACGDTGMGAMAEVGQLVDKIKMYI